MADFKEIIDSFLMGSVVEPDTSKDIVVYLITKKQLVGKLVASGEDYIEFKTTTRNYIVPLSSIESVGVEE